MMMTKERGPRENPNNKSACVGVVSEETRFIRIKSAPSVSGLISMYHKINHNPF